MAIRTMEYGGAAGLAVVSDWVDSKIKRFVTAATNGQLLKLAVVGADLFGFGNGHRYAEPIRTGAAEYAVGSLVSDFTRAQLLKTAPISTAPIITHPAVSTAASHPALAAATGVPASGSSAALDLATPGF